MSFTSLPLLLQCKSFIFKISPVTSSLPVAFVTESRPRGVTDIKAHILVRSDCSVRSYFNVSITPSPQQNWRIRFYLHFFHSFNFLGEKKKKKNCWGRLSSFSCFIILPSLFAIDKRFHCFNRLIFNLMESSCNLIIHIGELEKLLC